jgi:hypothetical protein
MKRREAMERPPVDPDILKGVVEAMYARGGTDCLRERERQVLALRGEGKKLRHIADILGMSREGVRHIELRAERKMAKVALGRAAGWLKGLDEDASAYRNYTSKLTRPCEASPPPKPRKKPALLDQMPIFGGRPTVRSWSRGGEWVPIAQLHVGIGGEWDIGSAVDAFVGQVREPSPEEQAAQVLAHYRRQMRRIAQGFKGARCYR